MSKLVLQSRRVVFLDGERPARLTIEDGLITEISSYEDPREGASDLIDYGNLAILPGLIDTHVHFNEPGRTAWEGWDTGTKAALAGGVTTVVEMPLNSIPSTVDGPSFEAKVASMAGQLHCDVGLWGGAVPGNSDELENLYKSGVLGFKAFMSDPGTAEFRHVDREQLKEAMTACARLGAVLLLHAEWPDALKEPSADADPGRYDTWLGTRPVEAEKDAIRVVIELSQETGCRCHVVHVATPDVLDLFEGSGVTFETCAHYLSFAAEEIPDGATEFKCAPPLREARHREGLWQALAQGKLLMVTSDHSPCSPNLKNPNFLTSWGGIAGVQMLLAATWTGAAAKGMSLVDLSRWLALEPAKLAGLERDRGSITVGKLAHLVVFNPDVTARVSKLFHRHAGSPYEGRSWLGVVEATYLHGRLAYLKGEPFKGAWGELVLGRGASRL